MVWLHCFTNASVLHLSHCNNERINPTANEPMRLISNAVKYENTESRLVSCLTGRNEGREIFTGNKFINSRLRMELFNFYGRLSRFEWLYEEEHIHFDTQIGWTHCIENVPTSWKGTQSFEINWMLKLVEFCLQRIKVLLKLSKFRERIFSSRSFHIYKELLQKRSSSNYLYMYV